MVADKRKKGREKGKRKEGKCQYDMQEMKDQKQSRGRGSAK
jgi:hypothetical protein